MNSFFWLTAEHLITAAKWPRSSLGYLNNVAGLVATGKFELEYGKSVVQILLKLANLVAQYV